MNFKRILPFTLAVLLFSLTACQTPGHQEQGMGMGMGSGMMARHSAPIPNEFVGLSNPVLTDEASLERGRDIYTTHCIVCHGEGGMGDGPSAVNLDPPPAAVSHTSQMMGDDYLFWRVTKGGIPFGTAMVPYEGILDEQARWDVINYIRSLGDGSMPHGNMNQMNTEAAQRASMLTQAVEQKVISQEEAELFETVHSAIDSSMTGQMGGGMHHETGGGMAGSVTAILDDLVAVGAITETQASLFLEIHQRLEAAGLMR